MGDEKSVEVPRTSKPTGCGVVEDRAGEDATLIGNVMPEAAILLVTVLLRCFPITY